MRQDASRVQFNVCNQVMNLYKTLPKIIIDMMYDVEANL